MSYDVIVDTVLSSLTATAESASELDSRTRLLGLINDYEAENWRYERFQDFIWNNIAQTSLSARE